MDENDCEKTGGPNQFEKSRRELCARKCERLSGRMSRVQASTLAAQNAN